MGDAAGDPHDIEVLARLVRNGPLGARVIAALVRRLLDLQDDAGEEELLAIIAQVEILLRAEGGSSQ